MSSSPEYSFTNCSSQSELQLAWRWAIGKMLADKEICNVTESDSKNEKPLTALMGMGQNTSKPLVRWFSRAKTLVPCLVFLPIDREPRLNNNRAYCSNAVLGHRCQHDILDLSVWTFSRFTVRKRFFLRLPCTANTTENTSVKPPNSARWRG